jgi:hypothetical protein
MVKYYIIAFLVVLFFVKPMPLNGQDRIVQGTITKIEKQKKTSFNSIPVTLYSMDKDSRSDPSITDINGSYYFYNVPEGEYKLEVWIYGVVDKNNQQSRAKVYDISINYEEAKTYRGRLLLKLAPIQITL